ncbi:MAG: hypothetical protein WAW80_00655 [Candidatus Saccharimonadales bacterium]
MRKLLIRHVLSCANDRNNWGTEAFNHNDSPLHPDGIARVPNIRNELTDAYGIEIPNTKVAISSMLRTRHTAFYTGFRKFNTYKSLDEVPLNYIEITE